MKTETNTLPKGYDYQICPPMLFIERSDIHGMGVFNDKPLDKDLILGKTHLMYNGVLHRLDFAGLLNHSDTPNCAIVKLDDSGYYYLKTLRFIFPLEELVVDYGKSICGSYKK
jgi:hypothetical protein